MILVVVYLGHQIFHPAAVFVFLKISFLGEVLSSQIEEASEKQVVHLCRSSRPFPYAVTTETGSR